MKNKLVKKKWMLIYIMITVFSITSIINVQGNEEVIEPSQDNEVVEEIDADLFWDEKLEIPDSDQDSEVVEEIETDLFLDEDFELTEQLDEELDDELQVIEDKLEEESQSLENNTENEGSTVDEDNTLDECDEEDINFEFYTNATSTESELIQDISKLGNITHYNGIFFGDFSVTGADIEGAVAIKGKATIAPEGGFQFGYYNKPQEYPTLLLGDLPDVGNVEVYNGPFVLSDAVATAYSELDNKIKATPILAASEIINNFFSNVKDKVDEFNTLLKKMKNTGFSTTVTTNDIFSFTIMDRDLDKYRLKTTNDLNILVINFETSRNITIKEFSFVDQSASFKNFEELDLVIFNFPNADTINFASSSFWLNSDKLTHNPQNHDKIREYAEKIIWNFPNANEIKTEKSEIIGSVLAPGAEIEADGGSINGMLIANSLSQISGFELHTFRLKNLVFELVDKIKISEFRDLTIRKVDANNEETLLGGAKFTLRNDNDDYYLGNGEWGSNESDAFPFETVTGKDLIIEGLEYGNYYLKEISAPDGYLNHNLEVEIILAEDITVSDAGGLASNVDNVITIRNLAATTTLTPFRLVKVDELGNQIAASGNQNADLEAKFKLTSIGNNGVLNEDGNFEDELTLVTKGGVITFPAQRPGGYVLTEEEAPLGYRRMLGNITIEIKENGDIISHNESITINCIQGDMCSFNVVNYPEVFLPATGGVGTWMFIVIGSTLIGGTIIYSRKKKLDA